jgi:hypothetical protein
VSDVFLGGRFGPGAVALDIGRASRRATVIAVVLFGLLTAASGYAAADATDTGTRVVGLVFAALFAIPLILAVIGIRNLTRPRGIVFDQRGVHCGQGRVWTTVDWSQISAVGIGFEAPPHVPSAPTSLDAAVSGFLVDKITQAVKLEDRRKIALEIYPRDPAGMEAYKDLLPYRRSGPAPRSELPPVRWRVPLPPVGSGTSLVDEGVGTFAPYLWLGWFQRPWSGSLLGTRT